MTDNKEEKEKEIDLLELGRKLWDNKKFIIKVTLVGAIVGLIIAFSIPKEYTTTVVLMPEAQSGSGGTMGSLAALAGINIGVSTDANVLASPDLYPNIFESTPFLTGLYNIGVKDAQQSIDTTLYRYLSENQRRAWWMYLVRVPLQLKRLFSSEEGMVTQDSNDRIITEEELLVLEELKDRITVSSQRKTGITTIEITMQSPVISAFLADSLTSYFQSYIINYRTQKARKDLEYAEKLCANSKDDYYRAQQQLAKFVDGNLNIISAKFRIAQERLQNEVNLAYSVYNQTAQQLQLAKIKVQNNTPVFTVIQPAIQPLQPTKPAKKMVLIVFVLSSIVLSICLILRMDLKELVSRSLSGNKSQEGNE